MSFRIKLLLTMMLLVAGVTWATLYVTERKVRATYSRLYQDQFEREVDYFAMQQEARLGIYRTRCEELAKSPNLRLALNGGDNGTIYNVATNELNLPGLRVLRNSQRGAAAANPNALRANIFFRILNAGGAILPVPGERGGPLVQATRKRLESQLAAVQRDMDKPGGSQVGFLPRQPDNTNKLTLDEVIVTKVADPDSGRTLGAIVLGVPFVDADETNRFKMSGIQSGIWLDDQLHSQTVPPERRDEVSHALEAQTRTNLQTQGTFTMALGGAPQRVFFRWMNPDSPFPPAYQVSLYSLAAAVRTEEELRLQVLGFAAVATLFALALSLLIAHGLSIPLRELVTGTEAVRGGNFLVKVPVRSRDEVGRLASSFNEMAEGLAQKERYRTVLNMVADEKVAQELVNGKLVLGGELREITVLFCDIRGFTTITQAMPPEEVIDMLNEHMTAMTRIVKEHNGVLDKFVGDLLMAIFGAPVATEDDALDAVRCALRLMRERETLNETSRHRLQMGVGIATGKVVAGCMGSADRLNYTVLGERVNLASRLCSQAGPGQVIIDRATREKLGDNITARELPELSLKGFSDHVVAYELTEVLSWSGPET